MPGLKNRPAVAPARKQDPNTAMRNHIANTSKNKNVLAQEYDVLHKEKPTQFWMHDLNIPQWLLMILVSVAVVAFIAFAVFAAIVTLKKEMNGGACKVNSDCRQDRGLMCNNYRCGCAYSHFWSETYQTCERQRMLNRTCVNNTECDTLGNLQCLNVTQTSGGVEAQCQCMAGMSWNGLGCGAQGMYNSPCIQDANCDNSRFLFCNTSVSACRCNQSMFWNSAVITSGACEYRRTVNQYCSPYDDNWCDNTGPAGQGLICANFANPYGSLYGLCQCSTHSYYNGSASLGNGVCVPQLLYGGLCATTSQCDYRVNLTCISGTCTCAAGQNYNPSTNSGGVMGACTNAAGYLQNCSANFTCSSSQNLYCDLSFYGSPNISGICLCNSSWSYWDGLTCASKLSLGGQCTSNTNCISSSGLFCSNYTQSIGQCDCDRNNFWNGTCMRKQYYNTTCPSTYVCDDNRGLQCQGLGGTMFLKCDCFNSSFIWDSLYINRSETCIRRLSYTAGPCYGDLECEGYNYLKCVNGSCLCDYTDYWDGGKCEPRRNYTESCNATTPCRDFNPVNLICRIGGTVPPSLQCLCNLTSYWEPCTQRCVVAKKRHEACTLAGNCSSQECDISNNLQCINDSYTNVTAGLGWCNCTSLQWWNGTYCRNKGVPAWGANASIVCNATYQCADYNLVSCPLGGNWPALNSTCECATTKYWNGITCLDRVAFGQACTVWPQNPVNTSTCLTAAGAGLICTSASCLGGSNCTGGTCVCPVGANWNSTFLICAYPPTPG